MQLPDRVRDIEELREQQRVFFDRRHAAEKLAGLMGAERGTGAIVLGVAAGGVPVAAVLAERLGLSLDVVVVSKTTLPWNAEAGFGAVAFDGTVRLNEGMIDRLGLTPEQVDEAVAHTRQVVARRADLFRRARAPLRLDGRHAVLVDDGIASGFTMRVAVEAVRNVGCDDVIIATPTAHLAALQKLAEETKRIYCANVRSGHPFAVADAYQHWRDVSEDEAAAIIQSRAAGGDPIQPAL